MFRLILSSHYLSYLNEMGFLNSDHWRALCFVSVALFINLGIVYALSLLTMVGISGYIVYNYGDFIYRSYLTLNRDLR